MELGRTQVERKLKALTGQTPVEFIRIMRLKRAAQKIAAKEDAVSQIAYSVGFNNLSYFATCFKEQFGESPSAWSGHPVWDRKGGGEGKGVAVRVGLGGG